jgi:hypothetical protein
MPARVLRAKLDGDEVLLNPDTGVYHLLNPTGRLVVEGLDHGRTLNATVEMIASDTGADLMQVQSDAESFVRAMVDRGLLEEAP